MTKIMAINAGSSSLKWKLYRMPEEEVLASGVIERVGLKESIFTIKYENKKYENILDVYNHEFAVELLLDKLIDLEIIAHLNEIEGIGHRVVAGGEIFKESVIVTDRVMEEIEKLIELAPLHNFANLIGIKAFKKVLPNITSVAVFDTSFHQTMPAVNYLYSLPYRYYEDFNIRKYGAHGTSHQYVSKRAAEILNKDFTDLKIITLHLGNGSSIAAIENGLSIDTSMGFTPLAGLTMGTRSGDIDPSIIPYLMKKLGLSDSQEIIDILNNESGIKGISNISSDMRDVKFAASNGNQLAKLSIEIFEDRIRNYLAQYIVKLEGIDAIVFTAGIGENFIETRMNIMKKFEFMGIKLDKEKNKVSGKEKIISTQDSTAKILLIPTDEELMIARDVETLRKKDIKKTHSI